MDVFTLTRACLRRWYVFVPVLVLTFALAAVQGVRAKAQYTQSVNTLIVAPVATSSLGDPANATNPLTATTVQEALVTRLNSSDIIRRIASVSGSNHFSAVIGTRGTTITLTARGSSASQAARTMAAGVQAQQTELAAVQQQVGAAPSTYFRAFSLSPDPQTSVAHPQRTRGVFLVLIAGFILAVLAAEIADVFFGRRNSRSSRPAALPPVVGGSAGLVPAARQRDGAAARPLTTTPPLPENAALH